MRPLALLLLALCAAPRPPQSPALKPAPAAQLPSDGWTRESFTFESKLLGEELRLFVALPPTFARSQRRYPLLFLLDGQYYFGEVQSAAAALADSGQIPELVLVGIESKDRRVDFTPPEIDLPDVGDKARAGVYLDFLEKELLPACEAQLRAGKPRVLLGHSHGALLALYAVAQRPQVFPWVIALDAPAQLEDGFPAKCLLQTLARAERPALRVVTRRVVYGWSAEQWSSLQHAARPGDLLTDARIEGESHQSLVHVGSYLALHEMFADSSALRTHELAPLEIDELYRGLAPSYGAEITPPEPLMRRTIEDFLLEGRGVHAGAWLERYVATYGRPEDFAELEARVKAVAALGEPTETVASLLALQRATPAEMSRHLGTWRGSSWRGKGRKSSETLRFRVEQGVVQGLLELELGPPIALEYIRFRPDGGLEFGFKNGMTPRGLIVYTEKQPGGPLEGEIVFRGMRFTPPPGEDVPPAFFELEKVPDEAKSK
jgi:pimeloyl-ACP methyl ester carboxylesterase